MLRERKGFFRTGAFHDELNLASLRRVALTLLKADASLKASIKSKRARAGWDEGYMATLLGSTALSIEVRLPCRHPTQCS